MSFKLQAKLLPTIAPVNVGYNASTFGRRLDPFSGRTAFHEGWIFPHRPERRLWLLQVVW